MKFKVGEVYSVTLYDHGKSQADKDDHQLKLEMIGRFIAQDKTYAIFSTWHYSDNPLIRDANCEEFYIVKKAIVQVKLLR
jgi:hypothetical protein